MENKISWKSLRLVDAYDESNIVDVDDGFFIQLLLEYRETESILGWFIQDQDTSYADCDSGPAVDEIDWTDFPEDIDG